MTLDKIINNASSPGIKDSMLETGLIKQEDLDADNIEDVMSYARYIFKNLQDCSIMKNIRKDLAAKFHVSDLRELSMFETISKIIINKLESGSIAIDRLYSPRSWDSSGLKLDKFHKKFHKKLAQLMYKHPERNKLYTYMSPELKQECVSYARQQGHKNRKYKSKVTIGINLEDVLRGRAKSGDKSSSLLSDPIYKAIVNKDRISYRIDLSKIKLSRFNKLYKYWFECPINKFYLIATDYMFDKKDDLISLLKELGENLDFSEGLNFQKAGISKYSADGKVHKFKSNIKKCVEDKELVDKIPEELLLAYMFEVYTDSYSPSSISRDIYSKDITDPIGFGQLKRKLMPFMLKAGENKQKEKFKEIMRIIALRKKYFEICDIANNTNERIITSSMKKQMGKDLEKIQILIEYSWLYDKAVNIELFDHILGMKEGKIKNFMCKLVQYLGIYHCTEMKGVGGTNHDFNFDVKRYMSNGEELPDVLVC